MLREQIDPEDDDPPEWKELRSTASFLAYFRREYGLRKLKQLLAMTAEQGDFSREFWQEAADQLKVLGLHKVAALVARTAAQCLSQADMQFCPYLSPPHSDDATTNEANIKVWVRSQQYRLKQHRKRREELLRKAAIDVHWQEQLEPDDKSELEPAKAD